MLSLSTARSSLEEMLESLRREEEIQTPPDLPPALPPRPKATSRARLPSAKRPLPMSSEAGETGPAPSSSNCCVNKEESDGQRGNCLGAKKVKKIEDWESPYVAAADEEDGNWILEEKDNTKLGNVAPGSISRFRELAADDVMGRPMKKVDDSSLHLFFPWYPIFTDLSLRIIR